MLSPSSPGTVAELDAENRRHQRENREIGLAFLAGLIAAPGYVFIAFKERDLAMLGIAGRLGIRASLILAMVAAFVGFGCTIFAFWPRRNSSPRITFRVEDTQQLPPELGPFDIVVEPTSGFEPLIH